MSEIPFPLTFVASADIKQNTNACISHDFVFSVAKSASSSGIRVSKIVPDDDAETKQETSSSSCPKFKLETETVINTSTSGSFKAPICCNDKYVATVNQDKKVVFFSVDPADEFKQIGISEQSHTENAECCDFHPIDYNEIITAARDSKIKVWTFDETLGTISLIRTIDHESSLYCCKYHPGGEMIAACGQSEGTKIYARADGSHIKTLPYSDYIYGCNWSQNGNYLVACYHNNEAEIFSSRLGNFQSITKVDIAGCADSASFYANDNFLIVGSWSKEIHIFNVKDLSSSSSSAKAIPVSIKKIGDVGSNFSFSSIQDIFCGATMSARPTSSQIKMKDLLLVGQQGSTFSVLSLPTYGFDSRKRALLIREFSTGSIRPAFDIYNVMYTTAKFLDVFCEPEHHVVS